jgi:hypothetical protein
LKEAYQEVREHLRRQHNINKCEVLGKKTPGRYEVYEEERQPAPSGMTFLFKLKIFVFLCCVMVFSCYLYGGQDVEKGAVMVFEDIRTEVNALEEEEPAVKEAMGYCRQGYHWVKDLAKDFLDK